MKKITNPLSVLLLLSTLTVFTACQKNLSADYAPVNASAVENSATQPNPNPFGVIVLPSASNINVKYTSDPNSQYALTPQHSIDLAVDYGVRYYRMQIYFDKWANDNTRKGFLYVYRQANLAGLKVLLNVCWYNTDETPKPFPNPQAYGIFLHSVLDTLNAMQMKPELIVVENEEGNRNRHEIDVSSTSAMNASLQQYVDQLTIATNICNNFQWWDGTSSVKVTNGGFTTRSITYNVWDWLKNEKKDAAAAALFAKNSFSPKTYTDLMKKKTPAYIVSAVDLGKYYITHYQQINLSYINLHWYEPCKVRGWDEVREGGSPWDMGISMDSISPGSLDQVVNYLGEKFNQKVIGQEVGQLTVSTKLNKMMTDKFLSRPNGAFDYVCWFDGDSNAPYEAKALHNTFLTNGVDSYTKRSPGYRFTRINAKLNL